MFHVFFEVSLVNGFKLLSFQRRKRCGGSQLLNLLIKCFFDRNLFTSDVSFVIVFKLPCCQGRKRCGRSRTMFLWSKLIHFWCQPCHQFKMNRPCSKLSVWEKTCWLWCKYEHWYVQSINTQAKCTREECLEVSQHLWYCVTVSVWDLNDMRSRFMMSYM